MKQLHLSHIPREKIINYIFEPKNLRFFAFVFFLVLAFFIILSIAKNNLQTVPKEGGVIEIGLTGKPRFINPVLAFSQTDRDLSALVYSSLLRRGADGELLPHIASTYTLSEDKTTYTFTIREGVFFHDGEEVNADDVVYTINLIQDPLIQSPKRSQWLGITATEIDEKTVSIELGAPYSFFPEIATFGILPSHLWQDLLPEEVPFSLLNINPVGSGPYKMEELERDENESITSLSLKSWQNNYPRKAFIPSVEVTFFENITEIYDAVEVGNINHVSAIAPDYVERLDEEHLAAQIVPFNRMFALFFGTNNSVALVQDEVREAIKILSDKETIVSDIFYGLAEPSDSPLPTYSPWYVGTEENQEDSSTNSVEKAIELLEKNGWNRNETDGVFQKEIKNDTIPLRFTLHLPESAELLAVAEKLQSDFSEAGIALNIMPQALSELNQEVIRRREFEILLFGHVSGANPDLFSFWHSSGRFDPGINITQYTNIDVDESLEKIRRGADSEELSEFYANIQRDIRDEIPAVFLYSPHLILIQPKNLEGNAISHLENEEDRFNQIENWYLLTEEVWLGK